MKVSFCGECGNKISEGDMFCTVCGWEVPIDLTTEVETAYINNAGPVQTQVFEHYGAITETKKTSGWKSQRIAIFAGTAAVIIITAVILVLILMNRTVIYNEPVISDGIYYVDFGKDSQVFKMDSYGKNKIMFIEEYVSNIVIDNGWAYYTSTTGVYKIQEDGTRKTRISDKWSHDLVVSDGWVYFTVVDSEDSYRETIYRITIDGGSLEQINKDDATQLQFDNKWLYYRNEDEERCIYRIKPDGSIKEKMTSGGADYYDIADSQLYYSDNDHFYSLCRIDTNIGVSEILYEHVSTQIQVLGEIIYFLDVNESLSSMKTDGTFMKTISSEHFDLFTVSGDEIYYTIEGNQVLGDTFYKINKDGSGKLRLK